MTSTEGFLKRYRELEAQMERLAEHDEDVFLPNPEPQGQVEYVFVCMEPSLGKWARSREEAKRKVRSGFRNFLSSVDDFILHFASRTYLCKPGERYHITDFSKGAMLVQQAASDRRQRYGRWYRLLLEELAIVAKPEAKIIAVGNAVADSLRDHHFPQPFTKILHYSPLAAPARAKAVVGKEAQFQKFRGSVTLQSFLEVAENVLVESGIPKGFRREPLARVRANQLSESRQQLLFAYKLAFEGLGSVK